MLRQRLEDYHKIDENSKTICIVTVGIYALTLICAIVIIIINIS